MMDLRYLFPAITGCAFAIGFAMQASAAESYCGLTGADTANGDKIYHETCVACHGENGKGAVPGAPDFTKKGGPLSKPHPVLTSHIKNGFNGDHGPIAMPKDGGNPDLTDKDIKDVHGYLHKSFGCG